MPFSFMRRLLILLWIILFYSACDTYKCATPYLSPEEKNIDYSNLENWASHPLKKSLSDLIPKDQLPADKKLPVDIFFLYPTTFTRLRASEPWNASLTDSKLKEKTDKSTIQFQASVFNTVGDIYAPYYRQAHLRAYYSKDKESAQKALDLAYEDVKNAFQYYLDHYNKGRPFIIASHSQGTTHARRLIKEFIDGKTLQHQLIVAYIVGLPVFKNEFNTIKPCENPDETGCFCSWRTFKDGTLPHIKEQKDLIAVTNPISWTTGLGKTPASMHKGSVLTDFNVTSRKSQTAQIAEGVLWTNKPVFKGSFLYFAHNFHIGDYNLFYLDIKQNARLRAVEFLDHQQHH